MSRLARTCISRTMSSSVESIVSGGASSAAISSTAPEASLRPSRGDAVADPVGVLGDLGIDIGVDPLGLADLAPELLLRLAELLDLTVRQLERLEEQLLGHLLGAGLDHRQPFLRADDDEVHLGLLFDLGERGVDDELVVDQADPHGAHRPHERERRDHEGRGGPVDRQDVVRRDEVGRQRRADDLHLVREALRPERPDRAVDHARGENRLLGRSPLALEETAGDLPSGVHPFLDVHREREEVSAFARLRPPLGGREDHRVAGADDYRSVGLLGELPGLEAHVVSADGDVHRRLAGNHGAHMSCLSFLWEVEAEV